MTENNQPFPEQFQPDKVHGTTDNAEGREKYLREPGKIEDLPEENEIKKMNSGPGRKHSDESTDQTDKSGEEKKEDYINTDERQKDLDQRR